MSRSDWGIFAAIGAVAALLAIGWITEPRQSLVPSLGANPSAVSEPADAQQQARIICDGKCDLTFSGGALTAPSANENQPEEKQTSGTPSQVEVDDLWAQRRMAHWSLFTALMAGFGVMGVLWTLKAARDANVVFAKSAEQQLTAYVVAEAFEIKIVHRDLDGGAISWSFILRNAGQTPAFDVSHDWKCDWATPEEMEQWDIMHADVGGAIMAPGRGQEISGQLEGKWNDIEIAMRLTSEAPETIWIKGAATYRDLNKRTWRHEYCWCVGDPKTELLPHGIRRPEAGHIRLTPYITGNSLRLIEEPTQKN